MPAEVTTLVTFLAPLGVGGVLAAMIFFFYRKDFLTERAARIETRDLLIQLVKDNTKACESMATAGGNIEHAVNNLIDHVKWMERQHGVSRP